jgi:peptidoglycan-associated lipoprotein
MKRTVFCHLLVITLVLALSSVGCKGKRLSKGVTPIPPQKVVEVPAAPPPKPLDNTVRPTGTPPTQTTTPVQPVVQPVVQPAQPTPPTLPPADVAPPDGTPESTTLPVNDTGTPLPEGEWFEGHVMDQTAFAGQTVYFDFDRAAVKSAEGGKVEAVYGQMREKADCSLLIDGHCDERGTEEYNRSLGERRALSIREYLVRLGMSPERVYTRTWGEDRPAEAGHDEAAWSKNRRGEFILLVPKK